MTISETGPVCTYDVEFDGTTAWVHADGECIARFGKLAYEVFSDSLPRTPVAIARGGDVDHWHAFEAAVWDEHRYAVPRAAAPLRLHLALGLARDLKGGEFLVPVATLMRGNDPFHVDVWGRTPVTYQGVEDAIARGDFEPDHVGMGFRNAKPPGWDTRRVALLVENPDGTPIEIDVTSGEGHWDITDGFHRLAAAIYRGDETIPAILSGYASGYDRDFADRIPCGSLVDEDEAESAPTM